MANLSTQFSPMQQQVVEVFVKKLVDALRVVDELALVEVRSLWKQIGPAPTCPYVGEVMRKIQHALGRGHVARNRAVNELVAETVSSYSSFLTVSFTDELMQVVEQSFTTDHFVQSAQNTRGVYERAMAPGSKFDQGAFELELCLIKASAFNSASQTISRVRTLLEDAYLKKTVSSTQAKLDLQEKTVSQVNNFHGPISGQVNVAGESIRNAVLSFSLAEIVAKIDASSATPAEKEGAKSRLTEFLAHPIVAAIVGGIAGGIGG